MLQRLQTLWLLLAAMLQAATLRLSFFSGNKLDAATNQKTWIEFTAMENVFILILTIAVAVAALVAIFMYKDRKRQLLITLITTAVSVIAILLYFQQKTNFVEANLDLTSLTAFFVPVFLLLAARGIYKDEQLVKSADRLR
jgi:cell division protein FtsL